MTRKSNSKEAIAYFKSIAALVRLKREAATKPREDKENGA